MWKNVKEKLNDKGIGNIIDWSVIVFAILTLVCNLIPTRCTCVNNALCVIAGAIGLGYLFVAIRIFICNRPKFDWYLVNGNYLCKVVALVLLFPSIITSGFLVCGWRGETPKYSPMNLIYEENLYTCKNLDTLGVSKSEVFTDPILLRTHNLHIGGDSILVQTGKLPETITSNQESPSVFWTVYYHFIDPGNQHMTTSKSGRGLSALIAILGVFLLNGLLVSSIVGWIDSRKEKWLKGDIKYPCFLRRNKHYVIIGGNDMVAGIVKQIISPNNYILIQTSSDIESFRRELFSTLNEEQQKQIIIYYGNRTSREDINQLGLCRADEVYILGEETRNDDMESYHDTMNMECLDLIYDNYKNSKCGISITQLLENKKRVCDEIKETDDEQQKRILENKKEEIEKKLGEQQLLDCRVMFEYQTTFSVFQFYDLEKEKSSYINFRPFNYYEMWAQKVFIHREINPEKIKANSINGGYLPLEGWDGIKKDDDAYVHLFVVGMSRIGCAMAIETAHLAHFPNYSEEKKIRTKITFIDKNAKEERDFFVGRFKALFNLSHSRYGSSDNDGELLWQESYTPLAYDYLGGDFLDIEWEFINGGVEQKAVQDYILKTAEKDAKITIAICLPESNRSHAAALFLDKRIFEADAVQQVLVYNRFGTSIISALYSKDAKFPYLNKLKSFGAPEECLSVEWLKQSENIGGAIGKRYKEIQESFIEPAKKKVAQKDNEDVKYKGKSQVSNWFSNIYNGNMTWTKLRCVDYKSNILTPDQISLLADVEHNRWNIEQLLMNFRPLTQEEQKAVIEKEKDKEVLKGEMAHLNICSNRRLSELVSVDVAARAYDEGLTTLLPDIYFNLSKQS